MDRIDLRFRAEQISGSHLHGVGAERERRRCSPGVGDGTGSDHRHVDRIDDLRHQRERSNLRVEIHVEEHAAMSAGFEALRDDSVAAEINQPPRFRYGGCGADDDAPRLLQSFHQPGLRQTKMETRHLWPGGDDGITYLFIERGAVRRRRARGINAKLAVVRCKPRSPGPLLLRRDLGRVVAEKSEIEAAIGQRTDSLRLFDDLRRRQARAAIRPESACIRDRRHELGRRGAGHRRLDDRNIDAEQIEQLSHGLHAILHIVDRWQTATMIPVAAGA